jgi:hypothetical protein
MAKGQRRSNRELKKPKQPKKSVVPTAPSIGMQVKTAFVSGRKI